jgi:starch synthase
VTAVQVLAVASEIYPLVKTGGLADVAAALPKALKAEALETITLVPGYPDVMSALVEADEVAGHAELYGGPVRVLRSSAAGLELFVLDAPHLFARPGNPYLAPDGADWPDNALRYAALGRVAAEIGQGSIPRFVPHIVHAHDWQAGLTHAYLHYTHRPRPGTVMTVHNLAYQGRFPQAMLSQIGLPPESFAIDGVEYYGGIGFLKAGLQFADHITTVSPSYAVEIQQDEGGMGLGGLLRARADVLSGIINGIDTSVWDPETDPHIATTFGASRLTNRKDNKSALQQRFDLPVASDKLLLGVVSRMSWQKGLDLILENIDLVLREGMQLVLLGSGDPDLEAGFRAAANSHLDQIGVLIGYDEKLAHLIQAGADALLVPSRFEPCGLTQLCALRYGAIPIVSRVGGLADTVIDANETAVVGNVATGLQFWPVSSESLAGAIRRAKALFHDKPVWQNMQKNGMAVDVSWRHPARQYAALYRKLAMPALPR